MPETSLSSPDAEAPIAIVLAAGVGRRLGEAHSGPKMLLRFAGRSLLARRLQALAACGVSDVRLTVGHEAAAIRAEVERTAPAGLTSSFVDNPRYREGSLLSMLAQADAMTCGRPVLLMDGDVLHDARMTARLTGPGPPNRLLVDPELEPGDEPVKVCFRGGRIVDFRKVPADPGERHGESVGFFRFDAATAAAVHARGAVKAAEPGGGGLEYEEAIRDLLLADPDRFAAVDVGDLPWTEIDFPEDVARARDEILPLLQD